MKWDNETIEAELGAKGGVLFSHAAIRYIAGCISRERERLARIFESKTDPKEIAAAIRDESQDHNVFRWAPPTRSLDGTSEPS